MKRSTTIFTSLVFIFLSMQVSADDFDTMYNRLYDSALSTSTASVVGILAEINEDGSFKNADYSKGHTTDLRSYLQKLTRLASAYKNPSYTASSKSDIKTAYLAAISYWIEEDPQHSNWWYHYIAYSQESWKGIVLMADVMKAENIALYNRCVTFQKKWYEDGAHSEGANGADILFGGFSAYILEKDVAGMNACKAKMDALGSIQTAGEGLEADNMFGAHSGTGRQVYAGNYGVEYTQSMLNYIKYTVGTTYAVSSDVYTNLENYFIEGIQWVHYNGYNDPNITGRFNSTTKCNTTYAGLANTLMSFDTPQKDQLQIVRDRLNNGNNYSGEKLVGNKHYWRFDYMIHRRDNFYISSRMTSTRTVGAEAGNIQASSGLREGWYNYYAGAGVTYIFSTGKEYGNGYFNVTAPKFNYRQYPGITAEQDSRTLPIPRWGSEGNNGNVYAGGVTDGTYGASAMKLSKRGIVAQKANFFFDDEMVALGTNINSRSGSVSGQTYGTDDVYTIINHDMKTTDMTFTRGSKYLPQMGKGITASSSFASDDILWLSAGDKSYYILDADEVKVDIDTELFTIAINHGTQPTSSSYAYIVAPRVSDYADVVAYATDFPVEVLSNTTGVQAVRKKSKNVIQAAFYSAGTLTFDTNKTITVNAPCMVMIAGDNYGDDDENYNISVADPKGELSNISSVKVDVSSNVFGASTVVPIAFTFDLPQHEYAGKTVVMSIKANSSTAVEKLEDTNIETKVYPNPFENSFSISVDNHKNGTYTLLDMQGRILKQGALDASSTTIECQNISSGNYLLKIKSTQGCSSLQIIKSNN